MGAMIRGVACAFAFLLPAQALAQSELPSGTQSVMPMMRLIEGKKNCQGQRAPIGGYTRLTFDYQWIAPVKGQTAKERRYHAEARNWFKRFFLGKAVTRLFTVKATLTRPAVTLNTVLASITHSSNKKEGEAWTSDFNSQRQITPFFRIDPDSNANIEAALRLTASYDSAITANALDVVKRAVQLVAPKASLITSLNEERFDQAAQFADGAISSLLQEAITERANNDFAMSEWAGCTLASIELWSPMRNDITPMAKEPDEDRVYLGTWTLRASPVMLSIFAGQQWPAGAAVTRLNLLAKSDGGAKPCVGEPIKTACDAFRDLEPQRVMAFQVDANLTVAQALAADTGIIAAKDTLLKAADNDQPAAAATLCALVADKGTALGFNRFDTAAIVWAYVRYAFPGAGKAGAVIGKPENCATLNAARLVGLT